MAKTEDEIAIEVLPDGRLRVETDNMEGPNHMGAEKLVRFLTDLMGGELARQRKTVKHRHDHHGLTHKH